MQAAIVGNIEIFKLLLSNDKIEVNIRGILTDVFFKWHSKTKIWIQFTFKYFNQSNFNSILNVIFKKTNCFYPVLNIIYLWNNIVLGS